MAKYTTELRSICEVYAGYNEEQGYNNVNDVIKKALPKIFDFDFPIYDENYRSVLETKIVKHFYTREIGYETVGRWKLALDERLNLITLGSGCMRRMQSILCANIAQCSRQ